jgi:hypothetical protein
MKNKNIISPVGLKGNQINERMKELMGISSINENKSNIVVELTKMGPDGKAYAIIRENHEYYIKSTTKTSGLVAEDFKYIGGLQNKKEQAYPSYAKAIKHLNLRFNSLSEAFNSEEKINTFLDDNLLSENGLAIGFQQHTSGFSGAGNLNGNTSLFEEETTEEGLDISEVELTKEEQAVEDMMKEDDTIKNKGKYFGGKRQELGLDKDGDGVLDGGDEDPNDGAIQEHKLSISRAIENMDSIIDSLTESKKKVYTLK